MTTQATGSTRIAAVTGGSLELSDEGVLINGRPALTVEEVQKWWGEANAPILNDEKAAEMAAMLNEALLIGFMWKPEYSEQRKKNSNTLCWNRIAAALTVLRDDLPKVLSDSRKVMPHEDHTATESLLDLVHRHQAIIEKFGPHKKGRPPSLANNVAANVGKKFRELIGCAGHPAEKAISAFVCSATTWLNAGPRNDVAISRNKNRRTK